MTDKINQSRNFRTSQLSDRHCSYKLKTAYTNYIHPANVVLALANNLSDRLCSHKLKTAHINYIHSANVVLTWSNNTTRDTRQRVTLRHPRRAK